jgi:hypothetical protein
MKNVRRFAGSLLVMGVVGLVAHSGSAQSQQVTGDGTAAVVLEANGGRGERRGLSQRQRDEASARIEAANRIVDRMAAEAKSKGMGAGWRQAALEMLLPLNSNALRQVEQQAYSLDALSAAVTSAAEDPNLIGDPAADLTYTPIVPCRYIDTRNVGGRITGQRTYDLEQTAYGGVAGCNPEVIFGVADDEQIAAIAMNITIVDPLAAPGFVALKPTGAAPTSSLVNWYEMGPAVQAANQGIVSTNQAAATTTNFVIESSAAVHVIADFFGAFVEPEATPLDRNVQTASVNVANGALVGITSPACPATYTNVGGGCLSGGQAVYITDNYPPSTTTWRCTAYNFDGVTRTLTVYNICARIPGR